MVFRWRLGEHKVSTILYRTIYQSKFTAIKWKIKRIRKNIFFENFELKFSVPFVGKVDFEFNFLKQMNMLRKWTRAGKLVTKGTF